MKKKLEGKKTLSIYLPIPLAESFLNFLEEREIGVSPFLNTLITDYLEEKGREDSPLMQSLIKQFRRSPYIRSFIRHELQKMNKKELSDDSKSE